MCFIPAGEFILGSSDGSADEQPSRRIYLDSFQIDRYEVTNTQYRRFLLEFREDSASILVRFQFSSRSGRRTGGWSQLGPGTCLLRLAGQAPANRSRMGEDLPGRNGGASIPGGMLGTNIRQMSVWIGKPSWPVQLEFSWSQLQGNTGLNDQYALKPVGSYLTGMSVWGVFDLVGNASEWTADWYTWRGYHDLPSADPIGLGLPFYRSVRGSAWFDRQGTQIFTPELSRCARRNSSHSFDDPRLGFRCLKSAGTK